MSLPKSYTFHTSNSLSSDLCKPVDDCFFMPKRSNTDHNLLQDLINYVDRNLTGIPPSPAPSASPNNFLDERNVDPLPSVVLQHSVANQDAMDIDVQPTPPFVPSDDHHHASDSGLGSSIQDGPKRGMPPPADPSVLTLPYLTDFYKDQHRSKAATGNTFTHSAVTQSVSAVGQDETDGRRGMSPHGYDVIVEQIVRHILKDGSLKEFHPLVKEIPERMRVKIIANLRDLEKTLVFLAPVSSNSFGCKGTLAHCIRAAKEYSATSQSYLRFCETSIQCIHATVDSLSESDQRLPTDPPYTNYYFLDLMEQIRKYAAIMAATREKEAAGEELDEMDYSPSVSLSRISCPARNPHLLSSCGSDHVLTLAIRDEKIALQGGLSHDGKPVKLVREKNGKVIPLADDSNEPVFDAPSKRSLSMETDDDGVRRSMARRRKSDRPGDVTHMCRECDKEFKRPCDLTKHEKTHSRPWKCPVESCKYHELGWPTEKERDRHHNDKHSSSPSLHKCLYPPCTYSSKRESNCKQHMEKAHGWQYVRLKSNGRSRKTQASSSSHTPQTPFTPPAMLPTHTPLTNCAPSPQFSPHLGVVPYANGQAAPFDFNEYAITGPFGYTPATDALDYRRESLPTSASALTYSSTNSPAVPTSFEEAVTPEETDFDHGISVGDAAAFPSFANMHVQQHTPAESARHASFTDLNPLTAFYGASAGTAVPHLSPTGQADVTLYSPVMDDGLQVDEGFGEMMYRPDSDFTLFPDTAMGNTSTAPAPVATPGDLFHDISGGVGGQFAQYFPTSDEHFDELYGTN